jgi:hypothetical protein
MSIKIYWNGECKRLNISNNNLTSLSQINFSLFSDVKILIVSNNNLTNLNGCPKSVTNLYARNNKLKDLIGCPNYVEVLDVENNNLITLNGCPNSVIKLDAYNNNLNTLEYCSNNLNELFVGKNPLNSKWTNLSLNKIKEKSLKIKKYKEMITNSRIYGLWLLKNYEVFNIYTSNYINLPFEIIKHIISFI